MDRGLEAINLLRGIWNFKINRRIISRFSWGGRPKPVNNILLGSLHTVHNKDGSLASNRLWWFEPNYEDPQKLYDIEKSQDKPDDFRKAIISRLRKTYPFSEMIENAIVRYTMALDNPCYQDAFLSLWALLEYLTVTEHDRFDTTVRRTAIFYNGANYIKQVLNHLRERRNAVVHQGSDIQNPQAALSQVKHFCELIFDFLLAGAMNLKNIDEYKQFLDSPHDKAALKSKLRILEAAKKFHNWQ